jgi:hypothetical protein
LHFLARPFDTGSDIVNGIVNAAAGAFHWPARATAAQKDDRENGER